MFQHLNLLYVALFLGGAGAGLGGLAFFRSSLQAKLLSDLKDAVKAKEAEIVAAVKKVV